MVCTVVRAGSHVHPPATGQGTCARPQASAVKRGPDTAVSTVKAKKQCAARDKAETAALPVAALGDKSLQWTTCGSHTPALGDLHAHPGVLVPRELGAPAGHFSEISDLNSDFEDRNAFGAIIRAN